MRYIKQITALLLLLSFLGSCTKEHNSLQAPEEQAQNQRTITLQVSAPDSQGGTRAELLEQEGTTDFIARFKKEDKVLLYVVQEGIVTPLEATPFASLSSDGKQATLTFTLPASIDQSKPVDIIGYNGFDQGSGSYSKPSLIVTDKTKYSGITNNGQTLPEELKERAAILLPATYYAGIPLKDFSAPVAFKLEQVTPTAEHLENQKVHFEHLGAYEIVYFENRSDKSMRDGITISEPGSMIKKGYAYTDGWNPATRQSETPYLDLLTGEVIAFQNRFTTHPYFIAKGQAPGTTEAYVTWVRPRPEVTALPELVIMKGTFSGTTSEGMIPARSGGMQKGAAYITHGYWDGEKVVALDKDKNPRKGPFVTFTTDLPKGSDFKVKVYISYGNKEGAFIDLNANGKKDLGEAFSDSWDPQTFKVDAPEITLYGAIESIEVPEQGITAVEISPVATLYELNLKKNKLSKEALNKVIEQIPDRSGVKPSILQSLELSIDGNPGLKEGGVKLLDAVNKGWTLDVPIIRNDLPQNYIELRSSGKVFYAVDAEPADRADIWVDLNNNGTKDEGEAITEFGPSKLLLANMTSTHMVIYGKITSLAILHGGVSSFWGVQSDSKYGNPALKHLTISGQHGMMIAVTGIYPELESINLSDNPWYVLVNTAGLPFVQNPEKLKSLNLGNSGSTPIQYGVKHNTIDFTKMSSLTYLNIEGWNWNEQQADLSQLPKLERLVAKGNQMSKLNLKASTELTYVELIGNKLDATALNQLLQDLPDRTGKSPGMLYVAGNPGSGKGNYKLARDKNWRVDARNSISDHPARRPNMEGEDW